MKAIERIKRYSIWRTPEIGQAMREMAAKGLTDIRALNCALNNGVMCLEDFKKFTEAELLRWPNFGRKSLNLVKEVMEANGLSLDDGSIDDEVLRGLIEQSLMTKHAMRVAGEVHQSTLRAINARREWLEMQNAKVLDITPRP